MQCFDARYSCALEVQRIIWREIVYADYRLTTFQQSCSDMHANEASRTSDERSQTSPFILQAPTSTRAIS